MSVLATAERVVKCPTSHCPGWITVDDDRPQTVPCRYCRVTINTLTYLLEGIPDAPADAAGESRLPHAVHAEFNGLLLKVAGMTGGNVYLRPSDRLIVGLVPSTRGVIVEYNVGLGRQTGTAALVALLLHALLHLELHPRQEKPLGLLLRPGARDREPLQNAVNYLLTLSDHPWIAARLAAIDPALPAAEQTWGLPVIGMLTGVETFFPPYMAERNRRWIVDAFSQADLTAESASADLVARLATLSHRFFAGQREDLRRTLTVLQLTELGLRNPALVAAYLAALEAAGLPGAAAAAPVAARLVADLQEIQVHSPALDPAVHRQALEAGLKALALHTAFEVQTLKGA